MPRRIYLDNNATAPMPPSVQRALLGCCYKGWGNPDSAHAEGRAARAAVEVARHHVGDLLGVEASTIVFTSGGTEADNTAIRALEALGGAPVLVSAVEHKAVLEPARVCGQKIPVLPNGRLDADVLDRLLAQRPGGVSVMLANNEVGTLYPVGRVARMAHAVGALVHTDAVNAVGKVPIDLADLDVDLASVSAHKIGGPKGVGALYVHPRVRERMVPMLQGGGQEDGLRAGTVNGPGILAFGAAAQLARQRLRRGETARLAAMRDAFEEVVVGNLPGVRVLGDPERRLPNTSSLSFAGADADFDPRAFVDALDAVGVAASAGSACSCQSPTPSHVLGAMGVEGGAVRFSFGWKNTEDDAYEAAARVVRVARSL